jgi:hypothetical protein
MVWFLIKQAQGHILRMLEDTMLKSAFDLIKGEINHPKRTCNVNETMDEMRKL